MIIGVGTDIIEIKRIEKAVLKVSFLEKVFTENERIYYNSKGRKAETLAGIFAAKEATAKAMGTGFIGFTFRDIEIFHNEIGRPQIVLSEKANIVSNSAGIYKFHLSISHNETVATAFVIAEC